MLTPRRFRAGCAAAGIVWLLSSMTLAAHDLRLSTVDLVRQPGAPARVDVLVALPLSHLAGAEHAPAGALSSVEIDVAIRRRLGVTRRGVPAALGPSMVMIDAVADVVRWQATVDGPLEALDVDRAMVPEAAGARTRVRHAGAETTERWLTGTPPSGVTRSPASPAAAFLRVTAMGFAHVLDGVDHVAFVVGLVLLGGSLRGLLVTISAFTVAHSVTLGLAATGMWMPSPRVIEPLIALSIVAIALEYLRRRGSARRRVAYAFVFGLVHGFGLAGPLREIAAGPLTLSLVPFNLGVEGAQAAIVVAVWPLAAWLARHRPVRWARIATAAAGVIGLFGASLFMDRVVPGGVLARMSAQSPSPSDRAAERVAASFRPFAGSVTTRHDANFFYVESDGMPDHRMMVGITAWQQQVPLPQPYRGANAWRFPLAPVPAATPLSAKEHFFRGAIAIAANGVPIFNPIKNDGRTDTFLAGELDEFGGHGGRADDYHYHLPPLHLQKVLGPALPVAYALDGYPIYGTTEPDGAAPGRLDAFNGHASDDGAYHYHSTRTYPYLNGGFHGEVVERDGQVDPQPSARPVRPSTEPLRGATITGFEPLGPKEYRLTYTMRGETYRIHYTIRGDGTYVFDYVGARGETRTETYTARGRGRGGR